MSRDSAEIAFAVRRSKSSRKRPYQAAIYVLLVIGAIVMLLPLAWMVSSSLKLEQRVFQFPPRLIPDPIRLLNYVDALTYKPFGVYLRNTVFLVVMNELAIVLASSFCAYGFARVQFPGRDVWFGLVMATLMVPHVVMMVPLFVDQYVSAPDRALFLWGRGL
jgi:multiple sugar transport system permease protein